MMPLCIPHLLAETSSGGLSRSLSPRGEDGAVVGADDTSGTAEVDAESDWIGAGSGGSGPGLLLLSMIGDSKGL